MLTRRPATPVQNNSRLSALRLIERVIIESESLSTAMPAELEILTDSKLRAQAQAFSYGVLRWYGRLDVILQRLLERPLKARDRDIHLLLLLGLYELTDARSPDYAIVSAVVETTVLLNKVWAKGLVNAVLRRFIREKDSLEQALQQDPAALYSFPEWMIQRLRRDWPQDWQALLIAANRQAPMFLRVNTQMIGRDEYIRRLQEPLAATTVPEVDTAIRLLKPCNVEELPGFDQAEVSVQDAAAQQAAILLDPQPGERILDACAAPGGKTLHILQRQPELVELVAIDIQSERVQRIRENLRRANLESKANLYTADVIEIDQWWDGRPFNRILLDVPCTASGVIRRHPDIKWLRHAEDVPALVEQQKRILSAVWPMLMPGGLLLYCTCSLFRDENERQIEWFLQQHADAEYSDIQVSAGQACRYGRQILPGPHDMDAFFYAALGKKDQ